MKVLLVEDDIAFANFLSAALTQHRYQVDMALDGQQGWDLAATFIYDVILLDLVLPKLDGVAFCRQLRSTTAGAGQSPNYGTPVLLMTALDTTNNRVMGLDAGADDYVVKPVPLEELLARIRALRRRSGDLRAQQLRWGDLVLDQMTCEVSCGEQLLPLTQTEYRLLELFMRHPERVFSQARLIDLLWDPADIPTENAVRSHIKSLRYKLRQVGVDGMIQTIYKLGYRLRIPDQALLPPEDPVQPVVLAPEVWSVWQSCRESYAERLRILEAGIAEGSSGGVDASLQRQMEREAHTLAGSLGSFGLESAARLARQLEQHLQISAPSRDVLQRQQQLVQLLRQALAAVAASDPHSVPLFSRRQSQSAVSLLIAGPGELTNQVVALAAPWDVRVTVVVDPDQALESMAQQPPDAIVLNDAEADLVQPPFLAQLQRQWPQIPVIALSRRSTLNDRVQAARLGVTSFLQTPVAPARVMAEVIQTLQQQEASPAHLMLVDDDPTFCRRLQSILAPEGYRLTWLQKADQFWSMLEHVAPDLLILDINLCDYQGHYPDDPAAQLDGIDLCRVIRTDPYWQQLPVLMLSAYVDSQTTRLSFEAGADDVLDKLEQLSVPSEFILRVQKQLQKGRQLQLSEIDPLTGLSFRRRVMQKLTWLLHLAQRQESPLTLALIDLDWFKQINDRYGHDMGDGVLRSFGRLLSRSFREADVVGRWGGEEFIVAMYGSNRQTGIQRLRDLQHTWSQEVFQTSDGQLFQVTFSAGVAEYQRDGQKLEVLQRVADQRLYQAKAAGRNRVLGKPET